MRTFVLLAATFAMSQPVLAQVGRTPGAPDACTMFKPAEISGYLGEPVESGEISTLGAGCSWYAKDEDSDSFAMLNIWPKKEADTPYLDKAYEAHPELGLGGYAIKDWNTKGSWTGGFVVGDHFYRVFLNGPHATKDKLITFLKMASARKGGSTR